MKSNCLLPILMSLFLAGCGILRAESSNIGVSISGVNYSDQPITYLLSDPHNPASVGGEPVDPFGAGGLMCCFSLPKTWQAGIKVRVRIFDTNRKEVKDDILELPPYVDGKPGQLWAVYHQDGSAEVFSTQYGPPHERWPAKVKGWPVPSVEYRRKLWERDLNLKMIDVKAAEELLQELKASPEERLNNSWEFDKRYREKEIEPYSGPDDPAYKEYLQKRYEQFLETSQKDVDDWLRRRP
ncbi:DUF3304 domain-containing protein [Noviherbaspirillum sp. ST9]|uniref:DUF3304 domain-containing protein n=1 Tax=Noviherbaspirillum sp. ST9 TaxID=3401606 RepID=UPI003B58AF57